MYITPSLLSRQNWDDLAEAAKWSRANSDVLKDVHWIGGDPAWLEVYGWAAWTPKKAVLVLRNPADHEQLISLRLQDALELPPGASKVYSAQSPWQRRRRPPPRSCCGHRKRTSSISLHSRCSRSTSCRPKARIAEGMEVDCCHGYPPRCSCSLPEWEAVMAG